jgi:catechol 2,3-dioxygenase-like lactoylglutathione lyase family enzyme
MKLNLALITVVVRDYDEAISFYTKKLGFDLLEDTRLNEFKRWVVVGQRGNHGCNLLLARASDEKQTQSIGNQTGGRVFLFLHTNDFWRDHEALKAKGVAFVREPVEEKWGTVAVFSDLYGNLWDLIEPRKALSN